jgi:O-antigen/teichoic acid export membrane protein
VKENTFRTTCSHRTVDLLESLNLLPLFFHRRIAHRPHLVKIVENIVWLFFDKILRMGVGLLVGVWIARYLGPQQFGLLSIATAFVGLFGAIAGMGVQGIVVRDIVRDPKGACVTLGTAALLQFIGGLVALLLTLLCFAYLRPSDLVGQTIVTILSVSMLLKVSDVAIYWFESQVQSKYSVWVQNGVFLVSAATKVALILNHAPISAFVWMIFAETVAVAFILLAVMGRRGPKIKSLRVSGARAQELLMDSWPLALSALAVMISMNINQIMLGQMIGDEAAGLYSAAVRISEIWYFMPMVIVASVFPSILESKKRSEEEYYARLQKLYDLMVWVSIAVALPMSVLATPLVTLLFGKTYSEAGTILAIHTWAAVFVFLGVASNRWFLVENKQILDFKRAFTGVVINILLNLMLIPRYGPHGSAVATVVANAMAAYFIDITNKETRHMFVMKSQSLNFFKSIKRSLFK